MGQNKLENQIKEQLNSREIQPSAQAWDRLDAMLSVAEEKKTKRSFGWLYIAASVTVLLSVGLFFFNQESTGINNQGTVVGTETTKDSIQNQSNFQTLIIENNQENQVVVTNQTLNDKQQTTNNSNQGVSINNQKQNNQINPKSNHQNQISNREKANPNQNTPAVAQKDVPKMEEKNEIISNHPNPVNSKSDEELLAGLDKVGKQSTNKTATLKVDARSLLSQVDGELEMTFREKVINKVSKNYKEVKVALANRNNE